MTSVQFKTKIAKWLESYGVWLITLVAVLLRIEPLNDELIPYIFCDEEIWLREAKRMLSENTIVPEVFLSGSPVLLPVVIVAQLVNALSDGLINTVLSDSLIMADNRLLVMARICLLIPSILGSIYFLNKTFRVLQVSNFSRLIALLVLVINPTGLATSRYWYPDHFIIFPASLVLYAVICVGINRNSSNRSWVGVGTAIGLLASTKYTGILAMMATIPLLYSQWNAEYQLQNRYVRMAQRTVSLIGGTIGSFTIINYGAIAKPRLFLRDLSANNANYEQFTGGASAIITHTWYAMVLPFGILALTLLAIGISRLARQSRPLLLAIVIFPILLIATLSVYGFGVPRNTFVVLPFLVLVLGLGVDSIHKSLRYIRITPRLSAIILFVTLVPMAAESAIGVVRDWKPDSRLLAEDWIKSSIPISATVGVNDGCSGPGVPRVMGYLTVNDPIMSERLDYYVFDSYWRSPLTAAYKNDWWQRQFHFYRFGENSIPPFPILSKPELQIPSGYELIAKFSGDGPEIVVLRRISIGD